MILNNEYNLRVLIKEDAPVNILDVIATKRYSS